MADSALTQGGTIITFFVFNEKHIKLNGIVLTQVSVFDQTPLLPSQTWSTRFITLLSVSEIELEEILNIGMYVTRERYTQRDEEQERSNTSTNYATHYS